MSCKLSRLVLVASVAAGFSLAPLAGAGAADPPTRGVDAYNLSEAKPFGFFVPGANTANRLDLHVGEWVRWTVMEGEHTVIPVDKRLWGGEGSETLSPESERYTAKNFKTVANYEYYCDIHGGIDEATGRPTGMWGFIRVTDPTTTTTAPPATSPPSTSPPATQPPTPVTTRPGTPQTTAPPASSAGAHTPPKPAGPPAPTPTTAARSADKNKKPPKDKKEEETTTTTVAPPPPPPPVDIPAEAIIPSLPGSNTASNTEVQEGVVAEAPGSTPEGEAIALLAKSKRSGNGEKLLIVSGLGLGVLGLGAAGYKFANRSSKYFPA